MKPWPLQSTHRHPVHDCRQGAPFHVVPVAAVGADNDGVAAQRLDLGRHGLCCARGAGVVHNHLQRQDIGLMVNQVGPGRLLEDVTRGS